MDVRLHLAMQEPVPPVTVDTTLIQNFQFTFVFALFLIIVIAFLILYRRRLKMQKYELTQDDQWLFK